MIYNATLVRLDPPPPGLPGPDLEVPCALAQLSELQQRMSDAGTWGATSVAYLPAHDVPSPGPITGGHARVRAEGDVDAVSYPIVHVIQRLGHTLARTQVYLGPAAG